MQNKTRCFSHVSECQKRKCLRAQALGMLLKEHELSCECKLVQELWKTNVAIYSIDQDGYAL